MLYQYNHFSHLRKDCTGTNLKDRSAGNVIRYNWIEGGNKQIDLPDWYDTQHRRDRGARRRRKGRLHPVDKGQRRLQVDVHLRQRPHRA